MGIEFEQLNGPPDPGVFPQTRPLKSIPPFSSALRLAFALACGSLKPLTLFM
jgi:hypothetical protein